MVRTRCYRIRMATTRQTRSIGARAVLGGTTSVVETACPLDCPDACSLAVTVQHGKVVTIDGSRKNPVTDGYICAKVRQVRRARLRPRSPALSGGPQRPQGLRPVQARHVGRGARARRLALRAAKATAGAESILPLLLRRLERPADAGQHRRAAVAPLRHVAARAHGVRGADRRGQHGALRQDAVGHLPGLPGREADHPLGRQPVRVGHPPHPVRARGAEARREAGRDRSAHDAAGAHGRPPPRGQARHRRRRRAGDPSLPLRERAHRRGVPARAHQRRRRAARARRAVDVRARRRSRRRRRRRSIEARRDAVRRELAGARSAAAGDSSATATAATPRWRSWRCRRSAASSASAAAATR